MFRRRLETKCFCNGTVRVKCFTYPHSEPESPRNWTEGRPKRGDRPYHRGKKRSCFYSIPRLILSMKPENFNIGIAPNRQNPAPCLLPLEKQRETLMPRALGSYLDELQKFFTARVRCRPF